MDVTYYVFTAAGRFLRMDTLQAQSPDIEGLIAHIRQLMASGQLPGLPEARNISVMLKCQFQQTGMGEVTLYRLVAWNSWVV